MFPPLAPTCRLLKGPPRQFFRVTGRRVPGMGPCVPLPYERWQNAFAYTTEPAVDRTATSPRLLGFHPAGNPCTAFISAGGDCHGLCLLQGFGHDAVRPGAVSRAPRSRSAPVRRFRRQSAHGLCQFKRDMPVAERHETSLPLLTFSVFTRPTPIAARTFSSVERAARPV